MAGKRRREDDTPAGSDAAQHVTRAGKKRAKHAKGCDKAELLRREKQRELQELALKLRSKGRIYKPHKARAHVFKDVNRGHVTPRPSQQKNAASVALPTSRKPQADFSVAIVPIFWNQNPTQKKLVIAQCAAAQEILATADITSHIDDGSHFTPGQKMRHWEEKGVKVRLEIGPKDAAEKKCVIARSQPVAGQVAYKVAGEIASTLPAAVQNLLDMKDSKVPPGDISKYEEQGFVRSNVSMIENSKGDLRSSGCVRHGDSADSGSDGNGATGDLAASRGILGRRAVSSGDALADDFEDAIDMEDVSEALSDSDRKRLQKKKTKRTAQGGAKVLHDGDGEALPQGTHQRRTTKTVKF